MNTNYIKIIFAIAVLMLLSAVKVEASLSSHPGILKDTVYQGSNSSTVIHITNVGPTSVLDYQLSSDVEWISFSSQYGSINKNDTVTITVTYNTSLLNNGANFGNIYIGDPHHGPITIPVEIYSQGVTDINEETVIVNSYSISQNYPNPFNPLTIIYYSLPRKERVTIKVYNLLGSEILMLIDGEKQQGTHSLNVNMNGFSSGIYFYKMRAGSFSKTKKMILTK